jgi:hypothetical protein
MPCPHCGNETTLSNGPAPTTSVQPAKTRHIAWWAGGGFLLVCALLWGVSQIQIHRAERQQKLERAKQLQQAQQAAYRAFREALAGVKIACGGATFEEFRQRQLALDTAFETYGADLKIRTTQGLLPLGPEHYQELHDLMWACEQFWQFPIRQSADSNFLPTTPNQEANYARAVQMLFPSVARMPGIYRAIGVTNEEAAYKQLVADARFKPRASVTLALSDISGRCDLMLLMLEPP